MRNQEKIMSLYRFSERRYLEGFIKGKLSFALASSYLDDDRLTEGQKDEERERTLNPDLKKTKFFIKGLPFENLKQVEIKQTARNTNGDKLDYYMMSFTCTYDEEFFEEFKGADSCIKIIDQVEFCARLSTVLKKIGWKGELGPVQYFDPQNLRPFSTYKDVLFSKSNKYSNQQEFKIVLFPSSIEELKEERKIIEIGDLSDISQFIK